MAEQVSLNFFETEHLKPLARWLASPSVAPWYPDPADDLTWASHPPGGAAQTIIPTAVLELGSLR